MIRTCFILYDVKQKLPNPDVVVFAVNCRKRFDFASYVRCLADNVWEDVETDDDDEQDAEDDNMDVDKVQLRKPGRNYRNQVIIYL